MVNTEKLSKYEKTRVLSARTLQISENAPLMIDKTDTDSYKLAKKEFEAKKSPLKVVRRTMKEERRLIMEETI